MTRDFNI